MTDPVSITPVPTDDEAAAIIAAIQVTEPAAQPAAADPTPRWRWSGRWWSKPMMLRRDRPW